MRVLLLLLPLFDLFGPPGNIIKSISPFHQPSDKPPISVTDSSLHDAIQVYKLTKAHNDLQEISQAALLLGKAYLDHKKFEQAKKYFAEAKTMAAQIGDAEFGAKMLDKVAAFYRKQDLPSKALPFQKIALQYAYAAQKLELLISMHRNLGKTYWSLQQFDSAIHYYQNRIPLCIENGSTQLLIEAYIDVAAVLYALNRFEVSIPYYEQAFKLSLQSKRNYNLSNISTYLAYAYTQNGAYQKAYNILFTSLPILKEVQKESELSVAYLTLGTLSLQLGNLEESIRFFQHTLEIYRTVKDDHRIAICLNNLGLAYYHYKDYFLSQQCLFKSQKICIKNDFSGVLALTHDNLARVYWALEQKDSALFHYYKALEIHRNIADLPDPNLADVHTELGKTYLAIGEYEKVEEHISESIHALGVVEDSVRLSVFEIPPSNSPISGEEYLDLMRLKGDYLSKAFDDTAAWVAGLRHYEKGIDFLLNSYVFAQDLDQSKLAWLTMYRPMFEEGIALAYRLFEATHEAGYLERAFALVEQNKAMLLRQSLRESQAKASANLPDSVLATEQTLRDSISQIETALLKVDKSQDSLQYWDLRTKLTQEREAYFNWVKKIEAAYPEYYNLKYKVQSISLLNIQQQLPPKTMMVNYFRGEKYLFSFGVASDTIVCHQDSLPADWTTRLQTYYRAITDHQYLLDSSKAVLSLVGNEGLAFYQTLLEPLLENTSEAIEKLIVVPDEELNRIPFSALLTEEPKEWHYGKFPYLLRKMAIQYAYSANLYFQPLKGLIRDRKTYDFGGFTADYSINDTTDTIQYQQLSKAQQLVDDATNIMDGKGWKTTTKETFLTYAPQCRIIHFGGHALAGNANLSNNRLVFQADPPQERYLYLPEIYNLDLQGTALVVLSGCNTGVGEIKSGEGVISVARAFQYAGTQNLLLALNVIPDAQTKQLLHSFYTHLDEDFSIDESLQLAKLKYLESKDDDPLQAHPLFWASIITFGSNGTIANEALFYESSFFPVIVVLITLVITGFIVWLFREKGKVKF